MTFHGCGSVRLKTYSRVPFLVRTRGIIYGNLAVGRVSSRLYIYEKSTWVNQFHYLFVLRGTGTGSHSLVLSSQSTICARPPYAWAVRSSAFYTPSLSMFSITKSAPHFVFFLITCRIAAANPCPWDLNCTVNFLSFFLACVLPQLLRSPDPPCVTNSSERSRKVLPCRTLAWRSHRVIVSRAQHTCVQMCPAQLSRGFTV